MKCFAVACATDAKFAFDAGQKISMWFSSRGRRALLILGDGLAPDGAGQRTRKLREAVRYIESLDSLSLGGYLSAHGGTGCGTLIADAALDARVLGLLAGAYDIAILAVNGNASPVLPDGMRVPTLIVVNSSGGAFIKTENFVQEMLGGAAAWQPVGFSMDGNDLSLASRLARRLRVAFWGFLDGIGLISERVAEHCENPVRTKAKNADVLVQKTLELLRQEPEFKNLKPSAGGDANDDLRKKVSAVARRIFAAANSEAGAFAGSEPLVERVVDECVGFGPLENFLKDPLVTEIMVSGPGRIYVEKAGVIHLTKEKFTDAGHLMAVIERMVASAGRRVDESSPIVDARLAGGHRLNVIIPPLAIDGAAVTIRKFSMKARSLRDAVSLEMLSASAADFLAACVRAKQSIVISGGTGAGKTTLLSMLASEINDAERIVTIEDAAELCLNLPHVIRLEARPAGIEGAGAVAIRELVRNALRMRPDRIIVGECRGAEAFDMLSAMNTGHEGSLATVHANSPRDALARLETMVLMAGTGLPLNAIREQMTRAVRIVIQVARAAVGARRVVEISEVTGIEGSVPCMQTIMQANAAGALESTGLVPRFAERIRSVIPAEAGIRRGTSLDPRLHPRG